jgi:hypothetical protein
MKGSDTMQKFILALILALATTGLCLAQSDVAAPAGADAQAQVQTGQVPGDTVAVTPEPAIADDHVIQQVVHRERTGSERGLRGQRRRRDWVLGCRMRNLEFKNFPGTVTLQRRFGRLFAAGLGLAYSSTNNGPSDYTSRHDSSTSTSQTKYRSMSLSPEAMLIGQRGSWQGTVGLRYVYQTRRFEMNNAMSDRYGSSSYTSRNNSTTKYSRVSIEVPLAIERRFLIRSFSFAIGLTGTVLSAASDEETTESTSVTTSTYSGTVTNTTTQHTKTPMSFLLQAPFQGSTAIQLKFYF